MKNALIWVEEVEEETYITFTESATSPCMKTQTGTLPASSDIDRKVFSNPMKAVKNKNILIWLYNSSHLIEHKNEHERSAVLMAQPSYIMLSFVMSRLRKILYHG